MNEKYALDPSVPDNFRDLKVLLDQFGLQTGRFLAKYPSDFPQLVVKALKNLPAIERSKMLELWNKRKHALLPTLDVPYNVTNSWSSNVAIVQERYRAFDGVISKHGNGYGWPAIEEILYEEQDLPAGQGSHIPMRSDAYVRCVIPMMAASAEITLIDPYFRLRLDDGSKDHWRWPVLAGLLRATKDSRCESFRIILHRQRIEVAKDSAKSFLLDVEEIKRDEGVSGLRLGVEFWEKDAVGHGRYIFSILGGLQFDQGFEEGKKNKTNHVHWLSRPELDPILKRCAPRTELGCRR